MLYMTHVKMNTWQDRDDNVCFTGSIGQCHGFKIMSTSDDTPGTLKLVSVYRRSSLPQQTQNMFITFVQRIVIKMFCVCWAGGCNSYNGNWWGEHCSLPIQESHENHTWVEHWNRLHITTLLIFSHRKLARNQHGGEWNVALSLIPNEVNTNAKQSITTPN